jgi:hypothetical protein
LRNLNAVQQLHINLFEMEVVIFQVGLKVAVGIGSCAMFVGTIMDVRTGCGDQ